MDSSILDSFILDFHRTTLRVDRTQFVFPLLSKCRDLLLKIYVTLFCKKNSWRRRTVQIFFEIKTKTFQNLEKYISAGEGRELLYRPSEQGPAVGQPDQP